MLGFILALRDPSLGRATHLYLWFPDLTCDMLDPLHGAPYTPLIYILPASIYIDFLLYLFPFSQKPIEGCIMNPFPSAPFYINPRTCPLTFK